MHVDTIDSMAFEKPEPEPEVTWDFPVLEEILRCLRSFAGFHRRDMIGIKQSRSTTRSSCLGGKSIDFLRGFAIGDLIGEIGCVLPARPLRAKPRPRYCMDRLVT